mmetsp:Transcript_118776/g.378822  ORF Transcript_118776/g.378822 Transcript_118776/m.378822 type:complete len:270 (+) Transcript_118776:4328-5137(+)
MGNGSGPPAKACNIFWPPSSSTVNRCTQASKNKGNSAGDGPSDRKHAVKSAPPPFSAECKIRNDSCWPALPAEPLLTYTPLASVLAVLPSPSLSTTCTPATPQPQQCVRARSTKSPAPTAAPASKSGASGRRPRIRGRQSCVSASPESTTCCGLANGASSESAASGSAISRNKSANCWGSSMLLKDTAGSASSARHPSTASNLTPPLVSTGPLYGSRTSLASLSTHALPAAQTSQAATSPRMMTGTRHTASAKGIGMRKQGDIVFTMMR